MSFSKRQGAVGIAYQALPGTAAAAPVHTLICDDCRIPGEPNKYERSNNVTAEVLGVQDGGKDVTVTIDGIEPNAAEMGYLLWMFFGGYSRVGDVHTISAVFDSKYSTVFKDQGGEFSGTDQVGTGIGSRFDNMTIDQAAKSFAKIGLSGLACDKGVNSTPLVPSISLDAVDQPMSWKALQDGTFDIGYDSLTRAADSDVTSTKFGFTRANQYAGTKLSSNQPDSITEGGREITLEYTRDFNGDAAAKSEYAAYIAGTGFISVHARWVMSTNYVDLIIPHMYVTSDPMPGVGTGEDTQVLTMMCKAYMNASSNIIDIEVKDGNATTDYPDL